MLIGAALLCATDAAAQGLTSLTGNIVPTGVVSAIIGTPIFIWIARKSLSALARGGAQPGQASGMVRSSLKKLSIPGLIMLAAAMLLLIERAYGHLHWQISLNCSCAFLGLLLLLQLVPA